MSYSRKILNYLISDDPSSEKKPQLGCIAGIVQFFDGHQFQNLRGSRRTTRGHSPGSEPVENIDDPRGSVDPLKLPKRVLAFRRAKTDSEKESKRSEGESPYRLSPGLRNKPPEAHELPYRLSPGLRNRPSEAEFPYRLSPGLRNKSRRRTQSTESFEFPWQCEDDSMESPPNFTARSRLSCDGREIPRAPLDHRDAYRSLSLRTMDFPRISVGVPDSPASRPSSILAELMGLDEMPDLPLQASKAKGPAPPRPLAAKILLDQPKHKSDSAIQAQDQNNNPAYLDCPGKDSNLFWTAKIPAEQGVQNSSDVKEAFDEAEEVVKIYACSDPKLPAIKTKPVEKFGSLSPERDESGAFSSSSSGISPQKTKKVDDDFLSKRSKRIANKVPQELSNAASPHKHSSRFRSEMLPPCSPKDDANEKRVKKAIEIRLDKARFKRDEESSPLARCNSDSKFSIQSAKAKRSLDFSPKSRQINSKATDQVCKAEQKKATKSCEKELIPDLQPEEPTLMHSTEKYLQETTARSIKKVFIPDWQPAEPNLMHSTENNLPKTPAKSCEKEGISQEPDLMHSTENILQKTTAKPRDKAIISDRHAEEADLTDSTENILWKSEPRVSFHYNHKSHSNEFNVRDYVTDLFMACGLLKEGEEEKDISMDLYFPGNFSIDSQLFNELEKKYRNDEEADAERSNRRVLFDTVNEVLRRKSGVPPYSRIPQRRRGCSSRSSRHDLVHSVVMEIDQSLTSVEWGNTMNGVNKLGEKDLEKSILEAMDVSEVVLAVERGIFRDLMDEFLHDLSI